MKTIKEKATIFKAAVLKNELLIRNGYVLIEESWKLFGNKELHGENEQPHFCLDLSNLSNRELMISLHFLEDTELVTWLLKNTVDEDLFMLTDWMCYHPELSDRKKLFNFRTYPKEFEVAIPAFFENLNRLFEYPDLRSMLEGKGWREIHMDWGDMK